MNKDDHSVEDIIDVIEITAEHIKELMNPLKLPGVVYVCQACTKTHLPDPDCGLKKKSSKSQRAKTNQLQNTQNADVNDMLSNNVEDPVLTPDEKSNVDDQSQHDDNEHLIEKKDSDKHDSVPICKFFLSKKCKHGIKGAQCKFKHPTICKTLLEHGNSEKGCKKGESCSEFHPKMCYNSLKNKECFFKNCRYYHVKGTKRIEHSTAVKTQSQEKPTEGVPADVNGDPIAPSPQRGNFLGYPSSKEDIQCLKAEILEAMDLRIATLMSCIQYQPQTQQQGIYQLPNPPGFQPHQVAMPSHPAATNQMFKTTANPKVLQPPTNQGMKNPMLSQTYLTNFPPMSVSC